MIEAIMFIALGFLAASVIALVLLSAVWHRAVRLTTRRIEGAIPVSMAEIQADKDQLRAEFAMSTRRLESSVEQLKLKTTDQLAEIGRKTDAVRQLKIELEEKSAVVTALQAQERSLRDKLRATDEELSAKTRELSQTEADLSAKSNELAQMSRTLSEKSIEADSQRVELVALETQCDTLKHRVQDLERAVALTEDRLAQQREQSERLTHQLSGEREKVENLSRRLAEREGQLAESREVAENLARDLATREHELRRQIALNAEREREYSAATAQRERDFSEAITERERQLANARAEAVKNNDETNATRREAHAAARSLGATIDALRSEKATLETALAQLREDRTRLQQEVAAFKHQAENAWAAERLENALLRERINDVAAEVGRLTASLEGPGSSVERILHQAPVVKQNGGHTAVATNGESAPDTRVSLAERIRALQARTGRP